MSVKLLEGLVAAIINERELVVNIGTSNGVTKGIKFKVLSKTPTDIFDPSTGEKLGTIDRTKVKVQVIEAQEKLSICKTYQTRTIGIFPDIVQTQRVAETLRADKSSYLPPLSESESYVKVGDRVVQMIEDE